MSNLDGWSQQAEILNLSLPYKDIFPHKKISMISLFDFDLSFIFSEKKMKDAIN